MRKTVLRPSKALWVWGATSGQKRCRASRSLAVLYTEAAACAGSQAETAWTRSSLDYFLPSHQQRGQVQALEALLVCPSWPHHPFPNSVLAAFPQIHPAFSHSHEFAQMSHPFHHVGTSSGLGPVDTRPRGGKFTFCPVAPSPLGKVAIEKDDYGDRWYVCKETHTAPFPVALL